MKLTLVTGGNVFVRKLVARYFNLRIMKFNIRGLANILTVLYAYH